MTYQYFRLAAGRLKRYRDIDYIEPCDEHGSLLPYQGWEDDLYRYATKQIISFEVKDHIAYCRLKGVSAC